MEYRVHFNLNRAKRKLKRGLWTVLKKGNSKVAFYADSIILTDATFHHGSDACVGAIVRKGSRAVCAWISGSSTATTEQPHYYDATEAANGAYYRDEKAYRDDFVEIHYNPFRCPDFTDRYGKKVAAAEVVVFPASDDGVQRGYCLASGIRYA
jgi:hypothetical protein